MKYTLSYFYSDIERIYGKHKECGVVEVPKRIEWDFEGTPYYLEWNKTDKPLYILLEDTFLLALFSSKNPIHPHPNNLVLYNLKKEVVKIIAPPKAKGSKCELPIIGISDIKVINEEHFIPVHIASGDSAEEFYQETHFLDLVNFEFHSTYYDVMQTFGRSNVPTRYEKYGR